MRTAAVAGVLTASVLGAGMARAKDEPSTESTATAKGNDNHVNAAGGDISLTTNNQPMNNNCNVAYACSPAPPATFVPPTPAPVAPLAPPVRGGPTASATPRIAAVAVGSAGVAALGLAAFFGVRTRALLRNSDEFCNGSLCTDQRGIDLINDARRSQTAGIVLGVAGALAIAGASALYFTAATAGTESAAGPRIRLGLEGLAVRGAVYW